MNRVYYKKLYLDFINDIDIPTLIKRELKAKIMNQGNDGLSYRLLKEINCIVKRNIGGDNYNEKYEKHLKVYDEGHILYILEYQKKNNLSNKDISLKFKLSRNTIAKWKKSF